MAHFPDDIFPNKIICSFQTGTLVKKTRLMPGQVIKHQVSTNYYVTLATFEMNNLKMITWILKTPSLWLIVPVQVTFVSKTKYFFQLKRRKPLSPTGKTFAHNISTEPTLKKDVTCCFDPITKMFKNKIKSFSKSFAMVKSNIRALAIEKQKEKYIVYVCFQKYVHIYFYSNI